eukprot:2149824-Prymnesium_polylepis.1
MAARGGTCAWVSLYCGIRAGEIVCVCVCQLGACVFIPGRAVAPRDAESLCARAESARRASAGGTIHSADATAPQRDADALARHGVRVRDQDSAVVTCEMCSLDVA